MHKEKTESRVYKLTAWKHWKHKSVTIPYHLTWKVAEIAVYIVHNKKNASENCTETQFITFR